MDNSRLAECLPTAADSVTGLIDYVGSFQNDDHAWISIASAEQLQAQIDALTGKSPAELSLYGIPFAVKDNIDVAGFIHCSL